MFSPPSTGQPQQLSPMPAGSTFTVKYAAAPLSIWRRNRGMVCLYFDVLDTDGFICLPIPKWFRRHRWNWYIPSTVTTQSSNGSKGLSYTRYKIVPQGIKTYLDAVVLQKVTALLRQKNLADFKLVIHTPTLCRTSQ